MDLRSKRLWTGILLDSFIIAVWLLAGCNQTQTSLPNSVVDTSEPAETAEIVTPLTPTATLVPMAATVNGEGIPLAFYEAEEVRYKLAMDSIGEIVPPNDEMQDIILKELIDQTLLAQAANVAGFIVTEELLQQRIETLATDMGGQEALDQWMSTQGYNQVDFEAAMRLAIASAWQRDAIIANVPEAVEQVHARQIFAYTSEGAQKAMTSLISGTDFDELAWTYSPVTGGELGWFPRGYLTVPAVEEVAFSLAVGEYSQIIESELGYHIVLVLEKDAERPLTTDAKLTLQRQALAQWIQTQREQAIIEISLP